MKKKQLAELKCWFDNYVGGFYGKSEFIDANIKLKHDHTHRTCSEIIFLADELNLTENQKLLTETIALLHDIGRFEQFITYKTYNDIASVDHSDLGLQIIRRVGILDELEIPERQLIEKAIQLHGSKELPADLDSQCLLLSQLIRDADKLDIFYVVITYYEQFRNDPEGCNLEIEFPDKPQCSPEIIRSILNEQLVNYRKLRTLNDMKLLQLSWVYDVNFGATLKRIKQRRFLEKIISFLPQTEEMEKVENKVLQYINQKLQELP